MFSNHEKMNKIHNSYLTDITEYYNNNKNIIKVQTHFNSALTTHEYMYHISMQ